MTEVEKDFKVLAFHAEKEGALMRDLGIGLDDPGKVTEEKGLEGKEKQERGKKKKKGLEGREGHR